MEREEEGLCEEGKRKRVSVKNLGEEREGVKERLLVNLPERRTSETAARQMTSSGFAQGEVRKQHVQSPRTKGGRRRPACALECCPSCNLAAFSASATAWSTQHDTAHSPGEPLWCGSHRTCSVSCPHQRQDA